MAEQNRRTPEQIQARNMAKLVVDQAMNCHAKQRRIAEIAREGRHQQGAMVDFLGELPESSGFHAVCKLAAKCDRIRLLEPNEDELRAAVVMGLLMTKSEIQAQALVVDRMLRGRTRTIALDPFNPEQSVNIYWDDDACGEYLDTDAKTFQRRVAKGYASLELLLGVGHREAA